MSQLNNKMPRALQDAPKIVVSTVALMDELASVLDAEFEIVTKRKMREHADLLKRKQRLAIDYRANMRTIGAQPDLLKNMPAEAKKAIRDAAKRLAKATDANARMLRAAVDATRTLVQNIVALVKSEALPEQTYKNHARAHLELGSYSPTCKPIAFNRTV